jgi:hypothetical protein
MLSAKAKPVAMFSDHFMRVFGLRPDYDRLVGDRGYATNVLLTAQRCSDLHLKQAAFELSTLLAMDGGRLSTAQDAAEAAAHARDANARRVVALDPDASKLERAAALVQETISTHLTPFKAHSLMYRLQRVHDDEAIELLLGDLQAELLRSVSFETAAEIMRELRDALQ